MDYYLAVKKQGQYLRLQQRVLLSGNTREESYTEQVLFILKHQPNITSHTCSETHGHTKILHTHTHTHTHTRIIYSLCRVGQCLPQLDVCLITPLSCKILEFLPAR
jgi:hypothetical protein